MPCSRNGWSGAWSPVLATIIHGARPVLILASALVIIVSLTFAWRLHDSRALEAPRLTYRGLQHVADGKLAGDLTIKKGESFSVSISFPEAGKLGVKKTWACWIFPEDTWAIGGNSEIELSVDDVALTHFAVARGEWKVLIQSLAEHITSRVPDPGKEYKITLRNAGPQDLFVRELWLRWVAGS